MISAILLLNSRGNVLISRSYRDDVDIRAVAEAFRTQIISTKQVDRCPAKTVGSVSFLHISHESMYMVAVTKRNINAAMVFQFLHKLVQIFAAYFDGKFVEESVRENFVLIYELLDEIVDFGYPQNTETDILKQYITSKGLKSDLKATEIKEIIAQATGIVNWRKPGIKYRKNEAFIDVIEQVNMLMSSKGNVLHSDVTGKIMMKCFLSGMPECKFGLNDKLMMENDRAKSGNRRAKDIDIADITFHQCVKLGKFDTDRTISFIPPDKEFQLMRYRITDNIIPPFKLISPVVRELGKTRLEVQVTIKSQFNARLFGSNVVVRIPCPKNTAKCELVAGAGSARYKADQSSILWTIKRFPGQTEYKLGGEVHLISSTSGKKAWNRPPISLQFQVPMFAASGLHVRFLKIYEKSNYQAVKWVRYITQAGTYENRI